MEDLDMANCCMCCHNTLRLLSMPRGENFLECALQIMLTNSRQAESHWRRLTCFLLSLVHMMLFGWWRMAPKSKNRQACQWSRRPARKFLAECYRSSTVGYDPGRRVTGMK
jgi:hypothetical protein